MTKRVIEKSDALRLRAIVENYGAVMERASAENWPAAKIMEHFFDPDSNGGGNRGWQSVTGNRN